jgi:hypothetical protein
MSSLSPIGGKSDACGGASYEVGIAGSQCCLEAQSIPRAQKNVSLPAVA